jgi:uncharacterized membrane protein
MKKYLVAGLILLLPVVLTAAVVIFLFDFFTAPFVKLVSHLVILIDALLPFHFSRAGIIFISRLTALLLLCVFIFLLGLFARWLFFKNLLTSLNKVMARIPLVRTIYKVSRDVFSAIFSPEGRGAFQQPVIFPFPHKPHYCIGFKTGVASPECSQKVGRPLVTIFAPTAPHPISGFLFFVPEDEIYPLGMSSEEAIKLLVSCGVILPPDQQQTPPTDKSP